MKNSVHRATLASLVAERLAALGAANIPASAREVLEAEVSVAVAALVQRRVTAPVVGRAVARALAAPAATEQGRKGGTPLPSSGPARSAQGRVAGPATDTQSILTGDTVNEADNPPTGEGA